MPRKPLVIYTAIFGGYEDLLPQPRGINADFVCFSDRPLKATPWEVRVITSPFSDMTRCARMHKILPHTLFPEYECSIWIDGNYLITGDVATFADEVLAGCNMAYFDHSTSGTDIRDCIYDEFDAILTLGKASGKFKDDPEVMRRQIDRYRQEGYPPHNGLIFSSILLRRHNEPDIVSTMNRWWDELSYGSKRDQLSFNYAAWKENIKATILTTDVRNNPCFYQIGIHRKSYRAKLLRYRLKRIFGLLRHPK